MKKKGHMRRRSIESKTKSPRIWRMPKTEKLRLLKCAREYRPTSIAVFRVSCSPWCLGCPDRRRCVPVCALKGDHTSPCICSWQPPRALRGPSGPLLNVSKHPWVPNHHVSLASPWAPGQAWPVNQSIPSELVTNESWRAKGLGDRHQNGHGRDWRRQSGWPQVPRTYYLYYVAT